ncbi:MAG: Lrp/AsnC family transcriptional regulator, partial [Candidatus Dormiibacterota bacterium]
MATSSAPLARLTEVAAESSPKVEVDELDLALLRALATDARQSQRALARTVEMSPPAVADRLARLERNGAIRGYRVEVDWAALGFPVVVYLAVTAGPGMDLSEIISAIRAMPEAEDMSVVTGGLDLLVRLRVRDHEHLRELLLTKIFQINGVQRTETFLSLADVEPDNFTAAMLEVMSQRKQGSVTKERGPASAGARGSSPGPARARPRDEGTGPWPSGGPGVVPRASKARQR